MIVFERVAAYNELVNSERLFSLLPNVQSLRVFIKPNLVVPKDCFNEVSTTDISVVRMVVDEIFKRGASKIIVGDCGFKGQWEKTLSSTGLKSLENCEIAGLMEGPNYHNFTLKRLNNYMSLYGAKLSNYVLESDMVINLPKLKVNSMALVTGAIKNMMGVMIQKGGMHPKASKQTLNKRLRDLYFLTRDLVKFCLCDGVYGSEYAEHCGVPVHVGLIISSNDMWEMDVALSKIMGINPAEVTYLEYIRSDLGRKFDEVDVPVVFSFEKPLAFRNL
jgi:uncharacterized protein (DUF362 family)